VGDSAFFLAAASSAPAKAVSSRHSVLVRVTHWITAVCFLALLVSGAEIVVSHPRFYWGETGNIHTPTLFKLPIPASRNLVPTGYGYVLPDQNGWSRYLHFQSAWVVVLTGLLYAIYGLITGHFRNNLLPDQADLSGSAFANAIAKNLRFERPGNAEAWFPLVIWTGLAMSPAFVSAVPAAVTLLGGQQSARTIHFFVSLALLIFLLIHVVMVFRAGFRSRMRAMIMGNPGTHMERT
jgi:thiosulfate reductase cytochrome b subunit